MKGTYKHSEYPTSENGTFSLVKHLSISIPEKFSGVKCYRDFIDDNSFEGKFNYRLNKLRRYLDSIKNYLTTNYSNSVDPIEYIYWLYYDQGLSFSQVTQRLNQISNDTYTVEGINKFVVDTFGWQPRDCNERTEIGKRHRDANVNTRGLKQHTDKELQRTSKIFNNKLNSLLTDTTVHKSVETNSFLESKFSNFRGKTQQLLYIASIYFQTDSFGAYDTIKQLKSVTSSRVISRELNLIFDKLLDNSNVNFQIFEDNIQYLTTKFDRLKSNDTKITNNKHVDYSKLLENNTEFKLNYCLNGFTGIQNIENIQKPQSLINKLNELSTIVNIIYSNEVDPVQYLIYLYYSKQLSVEDVSKKLDGVGYIWKESTLNEDMKRLGWIKRSPNKPSIRTRRKLSKAKKLT